jgi:hypothetical protein
VAAVAGNFGLEVTMGSAQVVNIRLQSPHHRAQALHRFHAPLQCRNLQSTPTVVFLKANCSMVKSSKAGSTTWISVVHPLDIPPRTKLYRI